MTASRPAQDWSPWACPACTIPHWGRGPLLLCDAHEGIYRQDWQPAGVTRNEAVRSARQPLILNKAHLELTDELLHWERQEQPGITIHADLVVEQALLRHTEPAARGIGAVRLTPDLVSQLPRLGPCQWDRLTLQLATGTIDYHCPAAAGLAWALTGVPPELANLFEDRLSGQGPTRCQSTGTFEALRQPDPYIFSAWQSARAWQHHVEGKASTERLDPTLLVAVAARVERDWPHLRSPSSLNAYRDQGFGDAEAIGWHRLLTRSGAAAPRDGAAEIAAQWRDAGFTLPAAIAWIGDRPEVLAGRDGYVREPWAHAELRDAGFTDLLSALPWLALWDEFPSLTAAELVTLWRDGVPPEWARSWARSASVASRTATVSTARR